MKIDIIIVNWNTGNYLKECVESLIKYNTNNIGQIIIVDNNSSDQSVNSLSDNKLIKIIKEKKNNGFGKACNIGAKYSHEKYLLLQMNQNTLLVQNLQTKKFENLFLNQNITLGNNKYILTTIFNGKSLLLIPVNSTKIYDNKYGLNRSVFIPILN